MKFFRHSSKEYAYDGLEVATQVNSHVHVVWLPVRRWLPSDGCKDQPTLLRC
jgi:hypothetical protein